MKKVLNFVCLFFILLLMLLGFSAKKLSVAENDSLKPVSTEETLSKPADKTDSEEAEIVKIYLIALEDEGKSGKRIATGDSAIAVAVSITAAEAKAPLSAALKKLLSIKEQYYGQSGLYNSIYQSDLKVDKVTIKTAKRIYGLPENCLSAEKWTVRE
jgi:predicted RND superfamily exporter protein